MRTSTLLLALAFALGGSLLRPMTSSAVQLRDSGL
jgi:hypothetical protein